MAAVDDTPKKTSAASVQSSTDTETITTSAQLTPLHHIHHAAYRCRDAEQTRWFYEDVLGFKLAAAMVFDDDPSTGKQREYMHLFFQMGDENFIAFFDAPDDISENMFIARHGFDQHIAFECNSMAELKAWRKKINNAGRPCFGPLNHGFIHSIYMYDPNGIQVEITVRDEKYDEVLAQDSKTAHSALKEWTAKTRDKKIERCGQEALDLRGIDMEKVNFGNLSSKPRQHK